jgi:PST family polysaccharide transporter
MADAAGAGGRSYAKIAKLGVLWGFGGQTLGQVAQFAAGIVLARLLTPYDFGVAAAAGFFLRLANKLSSVGFGSALVRMKQVRPEHHSSVFVVSFALGVTVWLVLTASANALAQFFHNDAVASALRVAALVYLLLPFGVGQMAELNRQFRFKPLALMDASYTVVFVVVAIGLAWLDFGYWSLILSTVLGSCAATAVKMYFGGVIPRFRFSRAAFREVVPFGIGVQAKRLLTFGGEYLDNLVVGRVLGVTALGFYDKAFSTVDRVVDRLAADPGVFFRIFSIVQDDPERLRRAYRRAATAVSLIGIPVFAVLIVLGPQLIPFVYGEKWRFSIVPFQILCVAGAFRTSMAYSSTVVQARGRIWAEIVRLSFYVAMVAIGAWLGAAYGIAGVAAAVAIANGIMSIMMQSLVKKFAHLSVRDLIECQLPALGVTVLLVAAMLLVEAAVQVRGPTMPDWQLLFVKAFAAGVVAVVVFLKPPFATVRDIRNETLTDLFPQAIRYFPKWAGIPVPPSTRRGLPQPGPSGAVLGQTISRL